MRVEREGGKIRVRAVQKNYKHCAGSSRSFNKARRAHPLGKKMSDRTGQVQISQGEGKAKGKGELKAEGEEGKSEGSAGERVTE